MDKMRTTDERTPPAEAVDPRSIRGRFQRALAGEPIDWPVYAVYDWFVQHRSIDWPSLFVQGLGQINHANLIETRRPNLQVVETTRQTDRGVRRDVRWITDRGELHEWYLGEWRQEYLIKSPEDYRIVQRALEGSQFAADDQPFCNPRLRWRRRNYRGTPLRTPLMETQIDLAGLERCSLDLADEHPALLKLLELMADLLLRQVREAVKTPAKYVKLWENLSIETIGRRQYRRHLMPLYHKLIEILEAAGKRLLAHYDGKLRLISDDVAALRIDGIDSFTPPPEGDMSVADARSLWPDKFLWLHPPLGWYRECPAVFDRSNPSNDRRRGTAPLLSDD